ncbi:hypothetical protein [Chitinophaga sp. Cy-1792]|uniref:hypothetical protein n=1 Tax=Chitinophaga sp. Cy-1792 TaxID=2608339 RepID=UPI0014201028|nr:hypothetical protein [Chitinophaga sp. Cy-1792]NIG56686.1 hypothetical protein [Chitinophaga sp. Cy-1792]
MGQRANYIIRQDGQEIVRYHHWRANRIAGDLYLGETVFLNFVRSCPIKEYILDHVWMEGCVCIDMDKKQLFFWSGEFAYDTSDIEYYLSQLPQKWPGWEVVMLRNRMYDAERAFGLDYLSWQEAPEDLDPVSEDYVINDITEEWSNTLVIVRNPDGLLITKSGNLSVDRILNYGVDIIPLFSHWPVAALPHEEKYDVLDTIFIDTITKEILINESTFGVWERSGHLWPGYNFTMGDYGYIGVLELAGIEAAHLRMSTEKVIENFNWLVKVDDGFDPNAFATAFLKENKDVEFNPDFFNNVKPQ